MAATLGGSFLRRRSGSPYAMREKTSEKLEEAAEK